LKKIDESYADSEKVEQLLINTLGWDRDDVYTFKDQGLFIKNLFERFNNKIEELKNLSNLTAKKNAQHLNVLVFIGHGFINE
jgi:hypothetical protein